MTGSQQAYRVRFERGESGLRAIAAGASVIVVVDVLSFCTAVDVAVSGGSSVRPMRPSDNLDDKAHRLSAFRAVPRRESSTASPYSLSPDSLAQLPPGSRLLLPSPNGASLIASAEDLGIPHIVAGCLRNASAVASYINNAHSHAEAVAIVAAGERWPDGTLRPALEDDIGAGAILSRLELTPASPEAMLVARSFLDARHSAVELIRESASGRELSAMGFSQDLERAAEVDSSDSVPILGSDGLLTTWSA
jgi:2-phosphosulfolactate phosphatase